MKLQGQVAVITGASSGVGLEAARRLAQQGVTVVLASRRRDRLEQLAAEISAAGGRAISIPTDITDPAQVSRLIDTTISALGQIDILLNSAGAVIKVAPLEQFDDNEFRAIMDANMTGVFYMLRAAVPHFKHRRSGIIINVGSRVGRVGVANISPFCAAKFALSGMSQALALELRPYNVYVTTLYPGMIDTDLEPFNPAPEFRRQLMTPVDVADAIVWLCTLPASLRIDELSLMPRQVDL